MGVSDAIDKAENLAQTLDRHIDGLEINAGLRHRMAGGCLDMALEHHKAMVLLIFRQLYGSAFSIMRLQFEAYIRGVWLHQCATESDLARFTKGKCKCTFKQLITAIERLDGFNEGILSKTQMKSWTAMNSFTHTGYLQVVRRNREATLEPNYDDDEIIEAVGFANAITLLAALEIANMAGAVELSNELLDLARAIITPTSKE